MLITLVYVSTAFHLMSNDELLEILRVSRERNAVCSVTGLLLYMSGNFMQVLEGEEADVLPIFQSILNDRRHHDIIVLMQEPIPNRQFADWQMAFANLDDEVIQREPAYSTFLQDGLHADTYGANPSRAYRLLLTFRDHMR